MIRSRLFWNGTYGHCNINREYYWTSWERHDRVKRPKWIEDLLYCRNDLKWSVFGLTSMVLNVTKLTLSKN